MKQIKLISILFVSILIAWGGLTAQQPFDNSFQSFQAKVSGVVNKNADQLSEQDLKVLRDVRNKDEKAFGEQYQKVIRDYKQKAARLIQEYDNQKSLKTDIESKGKEINKLGGDLQNANMRIDTLQTENASLRTELEKLNSRLKRLERQKRSISKANRELQLSQKNAIENLEMSRNAVKSMMNLLGSNPLGSEMGGDIPKSLSDSLNNTECSIAELLMNNYLLTLKSMENDKAYMDSVVSYMREHKEYPAALYDYFDTGIKLSDRLKASKSECAQRNAQQIQDEITRFQSLITSRLDQSFFAKLMNMLGGTGFIFILIIALVLAVYIWSKIYGKMMLMASYKVKDDSGRIINTMDRITYRSFGIHLDNKNVVIMKAEYPLWKNISNKMSKTSPIFKITPNTGYQLTGGDINGNKNLLLLTQRTDPYNFEIKDNLGNQCYKVELKIDWIK